jgi:hypothetical protein
MPIFPALRKFNTVALAIVLVLGMALLGSGLVQQYVQWQDADDEFVADELGLRGVQIDAGDRMVTLYSHGKMHDDARADLRFVDSRDGTTIRFGNDPTQHFYGGTVLGLPKRENLNTGYGYLTLAKTGEGDGKPLFDLMFIRFSDMAKFTLAKAIAASDSTELDSKRFSAVIWDSSDRGRFVLFDAELGKVTVNKDLDMQRQPLSERDRDAPPSNRFQ